MPEAYSLIRFSSWKQAFGQSQRRQAEWSAEWCEKNGCQLNESLRSGKPVSAFRGANRTRGALAAFLEKIRAGSVARGSVLLVESLDRLSREELDEAYDLFRGILKAGIDIVTRVPERRYTKESLRELIGILEPMLIMSRANEESAVKSRRIADQWKKRRELAREKPMNAVGPAWLRLDGGRWQKIDDRVKVVRRIFRLAIDGNGLHAICKTLNQDNIPPIGRGKEWCCSYIARILRSRAVLGEFQPHVIQDGKRVPTGEALPAYYPPVVDEATFHQAGAALDARRNQKGPRGKYVRNLFTGLLRDARDGRTVVTNSESDSSRTVKLVSSGAQRGKEGSTYLTFPYEAFEAAILSRMAELKAADVVPGAAGDAPDEVAALSGRAQELDHKIGRTMERLKGDADFDAGWQLLRQLEEEKKDALARLSRAQAKAATDETVVLGETQSLLKLLADTEGDERVGLRTRIKARIAQLVSEMWMLTVRRGRVRLCAVQVFFAAGGSRTFLITFRAGNRYKGAEWEVRSFTAPGVGAIDLRQRRDAERVERVLTTMQT